MGGVEIEVFRAVERAADTHLDRALPVDETLLHGAAEGAAVVVGQAEVAVPRVGVRVEVHEAEAAILAREHAQYGQCHRVVATHTQGDGASVDHRLQGAFDSREGRLDGHGHRVHVSAVGHTQSIERMDAEARVPRPDQRGLVTHMPGAEPRPRAIRAAAIEGDPDQRDVEAGGRGDVGQAHERRGLSEAWRGEAVAGLRMVGSGHAGTDYTEFRAGTWLEIGDGGEQLPRIRMRRTAEDPLDGPAL